MNTASISPSSSEWSMLSLANKDPFPSYELLRKRGQVVWDPGMECWLVLSYEACKAIESDEDTYRIFYADEPPQVHNIKGGETGISSLLGEKHTRMRRVYLKLLGAPVMPQYRDKHIIPVINDAIDRFANRGGAELVSEFADEIPNRVMGSLFELPWKDDALMANISRWHRDIVAWVGMKYTGEELTRKAKAASDELNRVLLPRVLERKDNRGDDFISWFWSRAEEEYGEVGVEVVLANTRELALGAGETTANAIANTIYLLLSEPALRETVTKDQEGALSALVEETLRLLGSLQWRFRKANRDVSLAGATIKKDDSICLLHAAANRDPEHYACPHMIDLKRTRPTDHLAFNVGPRMCAGIQLARLEIRECVKALINRLPNLRLDPAKEPPRFRAFSHRSYGPLHVLF